MKPPESGRELVFDALRGRPAARIATGPLAVHYCARFAGATLRQYATDARVLAESLVREFPNDDDRRVEKAFRMLTCKYPMPYQKAVLSQMLKDERSHFAQVP
ncbi:MAG TPA: hypothetical protein PK640_19135, partial [Verrucomicrobiota bacterium]|nr:hypothetical protein [Verrucomicrobiota bacterium]